MNLREQIDAALKVHNDNVLKGSGYTGEAKAFVVGEVNYAAEELLRIAKRIRETVPFRATKDWRMVHGIHDEMLGIGQRYSSFLWLAGLRDTVVDPIEHTYGIGFSSLGIYKEVYDKVDGKPVYILYNPRAMNHGDSYTLAKDGEMFFVSLAEFDSKFVLALLTQDL